MWSIELTKLTRLNLVIFGLSIMNVKLILS